MSQQTVGCLTLYDVSSVATHIGCTNIDHPTNVEVSGNDSGSLYEEFQSIVRFDPVLTATTKAIGTILANIGLNGQCVGTGKDVSKVDCIYRALETCQTALSATPHLRDRMSVGLLRLGTLSADRGQDATITAILDSLTDGTNGPVARTDGVAMPDEEDIVIERYTLGLPAIAGTTHPEVEGVSLEFGVSITEKMPSLGSIWSDSVGVLTVRPVLTLRGRDLRKVSAALVSAGSAECAHADTVIQLIARERSARFKDFGDSEHITITLAGLVVPENLGSAAAGQKAITTLRLPAALDSSGNAPVLFDLTAQYDTTPP